MADVVIIFLILAFKLLQKLLLSHVWCLIYYLLVLRRFGYKLLVAIEVKMWWLLCLRFVMLVLKLLELLWIYTVIRWHLVSMIVVKLFFYLGIRINCAIVTAQWMPLIVSTQWIRLLHLLSTLTIWLLKIRGHLKFICMRIHPIIIHYRQLLV